MPRKAHRARWREVGRVPVTLVHHVCECGCRGRRMSIVSSDGRGVAVSMPAIGAFAPGAEQKIRTAVTLGRELLGFWERAKVLAGAR